MSIEGIRYPADLAINDKGVDYFKIEVRSYTRNEGSLIGGANTSQIVNVKENILLPMPSNIQDANSVSWGEEKMNSLTADVLDIIGDTQNINLFGDNTNTFKSLESKVSTFLDTKAGGVVDIIKRQLAAEAVNIFGANVSADQILARQSGQIFNPNLELLFNGVSLREFRFSFKMTPRDENERNNIIKIIRTLKKYMSAKKEGDDKNLYLNTPNVFDLAYMQGGGKHPFLHSFKPCALKSVSVNYTGENVYATYGDGTPISLVMDLNFQEIIPIYQSDYEDSIGKIGVGW